MIIYLIKLKNTISKKIAWYIGKCPEYHWYNSEYIGHSCVSDRNSYGYDLLDNWVLIERVKLFSCSDSNASFCEDLAINGYCEAYGINDIPEMHRRDNFFCRQYEQHGLMINQQDNTISCNYDSAQHALDTRKFHPNVSGSKNPMFGKTRPEVSSRNTILKTVYFKLLDGRQGTSEDLIPQLVEQTKLSYGTCRTYLFDNRFPSKYSIYVTSKKHLSENP